MCFVPFTLHLMKKYAGELLHTRWSSLSHINGLFGNPHPPADIKASREVGARKSNFPAHRAPFRNIFMARALSPDISALHGVLVPFEQCRRVVVNSSKREWVTKCSVAHHALIQQIHLFMAHPAEYLQKGISHCHFVLIFHL